MRIVNDTLVRMGLSKRRVLLSFVVPLSLFVLPLWESRPSAQSRPLVLAHVNVIDVVRGSVRRDSTVTIADGRIIEIAASQRTSAPSQAIVFNATGKYLIPGLADMHVHWYDERFLSLFLANGVTTVRQMSGYPLHGEWRKRIDSGQLAGPRLVIASPIVDGPNPVWAGSLVVDSPETARKTVAAIKRDGYDFVKVYNRLARGAYLSILSEAKAQGFRVAGHIPTAVSAADASDAGQKSIEHLTGILLATSSAETRLRSQSEEALRGGEANTGIDDAARSSLRDISDQLLTTYDARKAEALFRKFAKNNTWQCPTLTVLRSMASLDDARFTSDARVKYIPRQIRESWNPQNDPRLATKTTQDYALERRTLRKQFEIVGAMQKAGVRILAGTDVLNPFAFPGFSLHDELALLVQAGLTSTQALQTATINPAIYLGTNDSTGTIEKNKLADLVLLDANPLDDIRNTTRIAAVVVRGLLVDRAGLDAMLAKAEKTANLTSIGSTLSEIIGREGIGTAIAKYRELKAQQADVYDFSESELNELGYALLRQKKIDEAIDIFRLNVDSFPQSANGYDSLAEAFMIRGDRDAAIVNYKKSLELDPRNSNAVENLKKLADQR
ncbi:MAG TPA: amidohydrolase family protein [Vicinamibacterales bacterium]